MITHSAKKTGQQKEQWGWGCWDSGWWEWGSGGGHG